MTLMNAWDKNELLRKVHSVTWGGATAAGVLTAAGDIVVDTGVGPVCAEIIALSRLTAEHPYAQIEAIASLSDGHIVAPCGSCRQALLDLDPSIGVIVPGESVVPVRELLPYADAGESPIARPVKPSRHSLRESVALDDDSYFLTWKA